MLTLDLTGSERQSSAQVLLGKWRGSLVAVKVLREEIVERASAAELHQFKQEAAMLQASRHPYILNFYGARLSRHPYMLVSEARRASPSHAACAL